MLESLSTKAVLTKVKAMYGRMLTMQDYEQLMHKTSVPACAAYLKSQTAYSAVLRDVQETQIHRGALEALLNKAVFEQFTRLARYAGHGNRFLFEYFMSRMEIRLILNCIRLFGADGQNAFMQSVPGYVVPHLSFDVLALGNVHTYDALLQALRGTPYHKVLDPLRPREGEQPSLALVEHALYSYYFENTFSIVEKHYRGSTAKELKTILAAQAQLFNVRAIYRLKCYFGGDEEQIRAVLLGYKSRLPKRTIEALISAQDAGAMLDILANSKYGAYFDKEHFIYIEDSTGKIRFDLAKRYLTFSQNPPTVFVAFMLLREFETENLINIIEGVRYQQDITQIRPLLITGSA